MFNNIFIIIRLIIMFIKITGIVLFWLIIIISKLSRHHSKGQEKRKDRKTQKSKREAKKVGFSSASTFQH